MREIGKMIRLMGKDYINTWMELNILVIGSRINNMEREKKCGQMGHFMKEITLWVKNMEQGSLLGQTNLSTQDNSKITTFMGKDYTFGMMEEGMKGSGRIIKWMVKVLLYGVMGGSTQGNTLKIKSMDRGNLVGPMEENIEEDG